MGVIRRNSLNWIIIILLFFIPLIPFYVIGEYFQPLQHAYKPEPSAFQYHEGDIDPSRLDDPAIVWEPLIHSSLHGRETGPYWFRMTLPENKWQDPHLYLTFILHANLYINGEPIFEWDESPLDPMASLDYPYLVKLPDDFSGNTLYIHSDFSGQYVYPGFLTIDSKFQLVLAQFIKADYNIVLGFVSLLISIIALVLYIGARQRSYLYFSMFALYIVYLCLSRSWTFFGLFIPWPWFPNLSNIGLVFGGYFFLRFYMEVFGEGYLKLFRRLSQVMLVLLMIVSAAAFLTPNFSFYTLTGMIEAWVAPFILCIVIVSSMITHKRKRDAESFWFMAGFVTLAIVTILYLLYNQYFPYLKHFLDYPVLSIFEDFLIGGDRFLHCIFLLLFSMVMILRERIKRTYFQAKRTAEQLVIMSANLEDLVLERTAELEKANLNLQATMQQSAETMAEVAVLEDRNRIAQDMHDHIGHSLTGTLMQLEAAKMLMTKDIGRATEKLELIRQTVDQGLEQIRETVHMMKSDIEHYSLLSSIQNLIEQTEEMAGITVHFSHEPLPDLDANIKKTLYLALKEGLTNGIRHGQASRFDLSLTVDDHLLHFRLVNNGRPYESHAMGFGLKSMKQRVEHLGGTMQIGTNHDKGCLLSISFPLRSRSVH